MRVEIDSEIKELIPDFLDNRQSDIELVVTAIESKDFKTIERIGHLMRGTCGGYGFDDLEKLGAELEKSAQAQELESIKKQLVYFKGFLQNLEIVYT